MLSTLRKFFTPGKPSGPAEQRRDGSAIRQLGNSLLDAGRLTEAEVAYREAILIDPADANAYANLGIVLKEAGREDEAAAVLGKALEQDASLATPHYILGRIAHERGDWAEAARRYHLALEHKLDLQIVCTDLCNALQALGRTHEAMAMVEQALLNATHIAPHAAPDAAVYHFCLGNLHIAQSRFDDAITCFERAVAAEPAHVMALKNLALALTAQSRLTEAIACHERLIALDPASADAALAAWAMAIANMRLWALGNMASDELERRCLTELDALDDWCRRHDTDGSVVVGSTQPFFLAYHREMNWRAVIARYGALCSRLMAVWHAKQGWAATQAAPRAEGAKLRLGIVCAELFEHSVWNGFLKGWYQGFDRTRLEIQTYSLCARPDYATRYAQAQSDVFVDLHALDLRHSVDAIAKGRPDVLLYPAIGMDRITLRLAALRLAPTQIAAWGHPETSGLPTMDYFISAQDFEPEGAAAHYTEQLIRLPHLGCNYEVLPVKDTNADLAATGIDFNVPVLICPGVPDKYTQEHDAVFIEIAKRLQHCQFVFFSAEPSGSATLFKQRLDTAFSKAQLAMPDYCRFIPWQPREAYFSLLARAQVYLDTMGFSGFNTASQALQCGIPVVAYEGRFMRGRLTSAILRRAGLAELVAQSDRDYVELAVKLASDGAYREQMRHKAAGAAVVFHDKAPIQALNDFLARSN